MSKPTQATSNDLGTLAEDAHALTVAMADVAVEPVEEGEFILRSLRQFQGTKLGASDGDIGHVCDSVMDARSWVISQLVVKTGHRLSGHEVRIPTNKVDRISSEESTVFVALTGEAVEQSSAHSLAPADAAD